MYRNIEERCQDKTGLSFRKFMLEYYTNKNLNMKQCAEILDTFPSVICKSAKENNIDLMQIGTCKVCHEAFRKKYPKNYYCSKKCHNKKRWNDSKIKHKEARKKRGLQRKLELIKPFESKCTNCGYNDNISSLCFHHIDPKTKIFTLDQKNLSQKTMEQIKLEVKKCKLLCANCHAILHEKERNLTHEKNKTTYKQVTIRMRAKGILRKKESIKKSGGSCMKCGLVSDYIQVFTFHHRDPKQKLFELNTVSFRCKREKDIEFERNKCDLLCFNCHLSLHYS